MVSQVDITCVSRSLAHGYIETIPKQGYRFTSSVREFQPNDVALIVEKHARSLVTIEEREEIVEETALDAEFLVVMARFDEGFRELKVAREIDPLSLIINADIGAMHFFARRPEQAIEQLQKTVEMDPTFPVSHLFLAMAYRQKGMNDEAFRELEEEGKSFRSGTLFSAVLGYCYAVSGRKDEARTLLEQLKTHSPTEFEIALVHTGLGDKDQAFEGLEKAYYKRDPYLLYIKVDPNFDNLRSDPRFQNLLRRLDLSD